MKKISAAITPFKYIIILFVFTLLVTTPVIQAENEKKIDKNKTICITFDELPIAAYFAEPAKDTITDKILSALKKHEVKAAGFVVGSKIEANFDLLGRWLNDGHRLGNLSYSHHDLNELDAENFIADIVRGSDELETMLQGFGQNPRYFRYPFLHYGDNIDKSRAVADFLDEYNIQVVHATVIVEDYLYNLTVEKSEGQFDSTEYYTLMNEYINHVLDQIERSELLSKEILKRNCRQILQLRANHLNALFLDELLTQIENLGYKFISLDNTLKDELYRAPHGYYGNKGLGYLDMLQESDPDKLPAE